MAGEVGSESGKSGFLETKRREREGADAAEARDNNTAQNGTWSLDREASDALANFRTTLGPHCQLDELETAPGEGVGVPCLPPAWKGGRDPSL